MYNEDDYENKAVKTITITPTYVEANRGFLEIPVDKLIDSIAKVDLSYDNGKTYTNEAQIFNHTSLKLREYISIEMTVIDYCHYLQDQHPAVLCSNRNNIIERSQEMIVIDCCHYLQLLIIE